MAAEPGSGVGPEPSPYSGEVGQEDDWYRHLLKGGV